MIGTEGLKILLDPVRVVGGDWALIHNGTSDSAYWMAVPRPVRVSPPVDLDKDGRRAWNSKAVADSRPWHVEHEHELTAEQIIAARIQARGKLKASRQNPP
ncbi:hypothetical protein [Nonomuraea sp. NPDC046570]|uniref:hypothetical protein n=1 Tax=Nonomuraea sp. NPDC046570 TaxID=3155255 RepID=UPI0033CB7833